MDPEGIEATEAKMVTMKDRRFQWSAVSDEVWKLMEENIWHYEDIKTEMKKSDSDEDCSDGDDSNWETDDDASDESDDKEDNGFNIKDISSGDPGFVDKEIECQLTGTSDENESDDCCDVCGDRIVDWKIKTDPSDPLFPLINVLSATSLIKCLQESPTSCNSL